MDALALLTADHNRVRGLFTRFTSAHEADDTQEMATLAAEILTELDVHAEIEEQVFYPAISEASADIREIVTEGVEEHHVVKHLSTEVRELAPGDEVWTAKIQVIIENVEHHAGEEEEQLFPAVRRALDTSALEQLALRMEALKAELGAPTAADKEHLTTEELQELARQQEIPGRSKMAREELVATVAPQ